MPLLVENADELTTPSLKFAQAGCVIIRPIRTVRPTRRAFGFGLLAAARQELIPTNGRIENGGGGGPRHPIPYAPPETLEQLCAPLGPIYAKRVPTSPDGGHFLTACGDVTVGVWDAASGRQTAILQEHTQKVYGAIYSPDGTRIASRSEDNSIRIWRAVTFEELLELRGHERFVRALSFSVDGLTLASAYGDGTIRLWRANPKQSFPSADS